MKYLLYTDNHYCERASIVTGIGSKYTVRLENQLNSINWVERKAEELHCDAIICLGDFFDKAQLTDQELTALQDIEWSTLPHYFLVGNHESAQSDLKYSSTTALRRINSTIISTPVISEELSNDRIEIAFLPYIVESDRLSIDEYFGKTNRKRIILSHNDIKGIQLGPVVSKTGFTIADIEENCSLFINGHLHNGQNITDKIINLGNLTGKDFGEDATKYPHRVMVIDTDSNEADYIENPYALNFYKLIIQKQEDLNKLKDLKDNAVLSIKCAYSLLGSLKAALAENKKVIATKLISSDQTRSQQDAPSLKELSMDYLAKFVECCRMKLGDSKILEEELAEICK